VKTVKAVFLIAMVLIVSTSCLVGCGHGGKDDSSSSKQTPNSAGISLSGTAATGAPIASATITLKDKNGALKTALTGTDGKYSFDITGMTAPFLLKVPLGQASLYSVATSSGTANVHPFTDLIIRTWYEREGSDVDTAFGNTGGFPSPPTAADVSTIELVMRDILSTWLQQEGVDASSFNLITSSFDTNESGFDEVLEYTEVGIDATGKVTVSCTDPTTGIGNTMVSTSIGSLTEPDATPPTDPTGLKAIGADMNKIVLLWDASTDNVGIAGYNVYRGNTKIGKSAYSVYFDSSSLAPGTQYCYQVEAFDGAGNTSAAKSVQACAFTLAASDVTPPSTPADLIATPTSATQISLAWTASSDNSYVLSYRVSRDSGKTATVPSTGFVDTGLAAHTRYCYTVKAVDAAGNVSPDSSQVCVMTL
jgi:chitodextrinase